MNVFRRCFTNFREFNKTEKEELRDRVKDTNSCEMVRITDEFLESRLEDYNLHPEAKKQVSNSTAFLEKLAKEFESVALNSGWQNQEFGVIYDWLIKDSNPNEDIERMKEMAISLYEEDVIDFHEAEESMRSAERAESEEGLAKGLIQYVEAYKERLEEEFNEDMDFVDVMELVVQKVIPFLRLRYEVKIGTCVD